MKPKGLKKGQIVRIFWEDSWSVGRWEILDDIPDPAPHTCETVGFVVRVGERAICVAGSLVEYGRGAEQYIGIVAIPFSAISDVITLDEFGPHEPDAS